MAFSREADHCSNFTVERVVLNALAKLRLCRRLFAASPFDLSSSSEKPIHLWQLMLLL
jgi:hypothetical protein